jgi:hypothetical protein
MKNILQNSIAGILLGFLLINSIVAQDNQKLAQSGFQFLMRVLLLWPKQ